MKWSSDMSRWKVPLFDLDYGPEESEAVARVLEDKWLTMGPRTAEFEKKFQEKCGVKHAFLVNNGTAALHLALKTCGIGPGDEVIVPSLTFTATVNAVLYCGATPVFADIIDQLSPNTDPEDVESRITSKTKAILIVHYAGYSCMMDRFLEIAEKHDLKLIEDAAHAVGGQWKGRTLGCIGDCGAFSLFTNKNLATGEGGIVTTNDDETAGRLKLLRSHAMTTLTWDRHHGHAFSYDVVDLGYNYRPSEITAALAMVQLSKTDKMNANRQRITLRYMAELRETKGLEIPFQKYLTDDDIKPAFHIMPVLPALKYNRTKLMSNLLTLGIQSSIHYNPVHTFTFYKKYFPEVIHLPKTEEYADREVTLPLFPTMTEEQIEYVTSSIKGILNKG
jgi:dTDP-4-amino-4,6-dideoxygalactose transaminase